MEVYTEQSINPNYIISEWTMQQKLITIEQRRNTECEQI